MISYSRWMITCQIQYVKHTLIQERMSEKYDQRTHDSISFSCKIIVFEFWLANVIKQKKNLEKNGLLNNENKFLNRILRMNFAFHGRGTNSV